MCIQVSKHTNPREKTMKKVLMATSALFLTAGVASAEITFSGTAGAGVVKSSDANSSATVVQDTANDYQVFSGIDINVAASATADNGMTLTATTDIGAGQLADIADKNLDDQGNTLGQVTFAADLNGTTITLSNENVSDLYDDDQNGDFGVSGAFGGLTYAAVADTDDNEYSYKLGYAMGDIALSAVATSADEFGDEAMSISASYTMGAVKATVTSDNDGAAATINTVSVAYTAGAATVTVSAADDKDHARNTNTDGKASWDLAVAYTAGAVTINASTNESEAWEADVAYDLGGGAKGYVATDSNDTVIAGMSFAF